MINISKEIGIDIKDTLKGIKSLISLKNVTSSVPAVLSLDNGDTITNPYDIANTFNNYFVSTVETIFQMKVVVNYFWNLLRKKK